jgi:hypothetical protein
MRQRKNITNMLAKRSQLWLDVSCGDTTPPGYVGMNHTSGNKVDVVHDYRKTPWPFPGETFTRLVMSRVVERIPPEILFRVMDEGWRVLRPSGLLLIASPYAGSWAERADPFVVKAWNEGTPSCFDPEYPLYYFYKPKPWRIESTSWTADGNLEVALRKRMDANVEPVCEKK